MISIGDAQHNIKARIELVIEVRTRMAEQANEKTIILMPLASSNSITKKEPTRKKAGSNARKRVTQLKTASRNPLRSLGLESLFSRLILLASRT
jgi:hypothetical protein